MRRCGGGDLSVQIVSVQQVHKRFHVGSMVEAHLRLRRRRLGCRLGAVGRFLDPNRFVEQDADVVWGAAVLAADGVGVKRVHVGGAPTRPSLLLLRGQHGVQLC
ncbi:MAG: hypothetical protein QOE07_1749 [Acidimicrobiaceae bacterium]|nr:hypothetical protein [Acidimicrobiaceae bacterium]